jgi:hypothetical protein
MSLVAGLLRPRLFSSKLSKLKAAEKYSGSTTPTVSVVERVEPKRRLEGQQFTNMGQKYLHRKKRV